MNRSEGVEGGEPVPEHDAVPADLVVQCVHASVCPGCPLIRDSYAAQLSKKSSWVEGAARLFLELAQIEVSATRPAPQAEGYRTRAKLVADAQGALGLYARGTHELVDLPACRVLHPRLSQVAAALRPLLTGASVDGVDLSLVGEQVLVTLIAPKLAAREPLVRTAEALAHAVGEVSSVAISRRAADAVTLLGHDHEVVLGPSELRSKESSSGTYHYAAHGAFQQVHAATAGSIYAQVLAYVGRARREGQQEGPRVLELYAGSGALSLALASRGARVVAVESFAPACERLARAAREQALNVQVRAGDAGDVVSQLARKGERFDVVLVNPPRRGLALEVRQAIARLSPMHMAYVSCNPGTLARDLAHLAHAGLKARSLEPFDMMPLTDQVETLAWLEQHAPPGPAVVFEQAGWQGVALSVHEVRPDEEPVSGVVLRPSQGRGLAGDGKLSELRAEYLALAKGIVHKRGSLERSIAKGGRALRTHYQRLGVVRGHSLIRCEVHGTQAGAAQIRAHFAQIGHPILGDAQYDRASQRHFEMRYGLDRPFLHRERLYFALDDSPHTVSSPLAPDLELVLRQLRKPRGASSGA